MEELKENMNILLMWEELYFTNSNFPNIFGPK